MRKANKAVFLDRDGVINQNSDHYYIYRPEDLRINEGVAVFLENLSEKGYLLIIITNQSGISRGIYTKEETDRLHDLLSAELSKHRVRFTEIYYCPHHPDQGRCLCRKPGILLLEKAIARFFIDPASSWFIGDSESDIQAGEAAGLKTLLIRPNENPVPYLYLFD
jgi:D-glycero-D-manno-heptose 1,7-bisphosphate phosphatase